MLDTCLNELLSIVLWLVKSDNQLHSELFEDWDVVIRCERTVLISHIERTRECYELARHYPIQIPVFHFLVMLILLDIEIFIRIPS
jgi:hypothetical protein